MTLNALLALARKHLSAANGMNSSARLCLADAVLLRDEGDFVRSIERAMDSLRYSVGSFHPDYVRAEKSGGAS